MGLNVGTMVSELRRMTVPELRRKYAEVHGEETRSRHREHLIRRIAWRAQANEEGDLPERARRRALEIASDADLRTRAPALNGAAAAQSPAGSGRTVTKPIEVPTDPRLPMPGTLLMREYKGRTIHVRVLPSGFDYEGTVYRSLSAVARAVTGAHWNGYLFFGLQPPAKKKTMVKRR